MFVGRLFAGVVLWHGVIGGPLSPAADGSAAAARSAPRKLHGRFLHITDIHPDEYYKVYSSTDEDAACHRGKGPAGLYGAETTDCDSPFSLVNATLDWIEAHLKDTIDFVIWTGDSARHDRDENLPRNTDQVLGTNAWIADKLADLFRDGSGEGMAVPVVPTFGNNDILPHNILLPGPNKWLQRYAHIWRHFIPEEQRHSFEFGGWFSVEVIPDRLAVFSLNTLYFFDRNAGVDGCASPAEPGYKQMEWLRVQLQFLRERGMKAILMGHVPPARTESKRLWDETCWQKYSLWVHQFRDVVVVGLYGHMNIDHFLIHDKDDIDIAALAGSSELGVREVEEEDSEEEEISVRSASNYLLELRADWAKLAPPPKAGKGIDKVGKGKKGKHPQDPWGEQYFLSLVSPSVVPNYFPTLRVLEYNITGLEHALSWKDAPKKTISQKTVDESRKHLELRDLLTNNVDDTDLRPETNDADTAGKKHKKKKKKKKKHGKKPPSKGKDPNLHVPLPPSESAPPGPAYSPQPFTLTGYTQYFANLTRINNLNLTDPSISSPKSSHQHTRKSENDNEGDGFGGDGWWAWDWLRRWRKGKHGGKKPTRPPQPREFAYEVEYSTFEDKVYRLEDLTVNSWVELAYRMGAASREVSGPDVYGDDGPEEWEELREDEDGESCESDEDSDEDSERDDDDGDDDVDDDEDSEVEAEGKKKKKKKKKGKNKKGKKDRKKKGKPNDTWIHFLRHAFVKTMDEDELDDLT
ncbi:hypothetical protein MYCTH_2296960 [Thermothelomyces thermophilus ATCC 42464]|uniref:Endopolyphosphatase n=1 Tax=Thermothelomyces thermophilus (strain ATCC 42464 / BCRC 31852 / DSM 1799) TaxID=573729 RepID=G2Q3Q9_THET4|nr:uncharacterized protein MYCTH_2296960 [Thermothelomyces thermophilus ATCC 42464]AEO54412.1 hypothetical protein MYCTH_2296960 [Thermothelomyces thermophilus ATCC 42464]